jgi:hypothetical protein
LTELRAAIAADERSTVDVPRGLMA